MLDAVIAAVGRVLLDVPGVDQVLTEPPAKLPDDRCFVVYPNPGLATLGAHHGRRRGAVYQADDEIRVDFHRKAARDAMAEAEPEARAMLTRTRDALFSAIQRHGLDGTIIGSGGIRTDLYGPMEFWDGDTSFGFQLALIVRHASETPAARDD